MQAFELRGSTRWLFANPESAVVVPRLPKDEPPPAEIKLAELLVRAALETALTANDSGPWKANKALNTVASAVWNLEGNQSAVRIPNVVHPHLAVQRRAVQRFSRAVRGGCNRLLGNPSSDSFGIGDGREL